MVGECGIWSGVWGRSLCGFRGSQVGERLGLDLGFRLDLVFACGTVDGLGSVLGEL